MSLDSRRTVSATTSPRLPERDSALALGRSRLWRVSGALAVLLITGMLALVSGAASIPPDVVVRILIGQIPGINVEGDWPGTWERIVVNIRLPRILLAGLVGATLAYSGATYQGVLRNPLADPYLIGVAAGAGFGATIGFLMPFDFGFSGLTTVPVLAFAGAMAAVLTAYQLARIGTRVPTTTLILAGVAISSLATAGMMLLFMVAGDSLRTIFSWLMGSLNVATWGKVGVLLPYSLLMGIVVLIHARVLNVLQLDAEQAQQLGINVERVKLTLITAASLATAVAVSVSGLIGFVGLIVPHMMRLLWGPDYRGLLPLAALYGAAFLILADLIARTIVSPGELPVGVVTAFFGAPFFLYLLRRSRLTYL